LFGDERIESNDGRSSARAVWHMYEYGKCVGALNQWYVRRYAEHFDGGIGFHQTLIKEIKRVYAVLDVK
jgi:hypothetical protein